MHTFALQSGSNGNSIYVEAGDVRLIFDAGISARCAEQRMRLHGRDIREVHAVLISHEHIDHVRGIGVWQRKFGLPVYMTRPTLRALPFDPGPMHDVRHFQAGEKLWFNGVTVHTLRTAHDATDGVCFVVEHAGKRLGILTDLGHPFDSLHRILPSLDAAYIESNYDPDMLRNGRYPPRLQARISGPGGHLSNEECAVLSCEAGCRLNWLALAHLSEHNNHPEVAVRTHRRIGGRKLPLFVASRYQASEMLEV